MEVYGSPRDEEGTTDEIPIFTDKKKTGSNGDQPFIVKYLGTHATDEILAQQFAGLISVVLTL